jgi:hypothetical protein
VDTTNDLNANANIAQIIHRKSNIMQHNLSLCFAQSTMSPDGREAVRNAAFSSIVRKPKTVEGSLRYPLNVTSFSDTFLFQQKLDVSQPLFSWLIFNMASVEVRRINQFNTKLFPRVT